MARRRLESAIQAARQIEGEDDWKSKLASDDHIKTIVPHVDKEGIFSLQYSFDGKLLAVGYGNAGVEILDAETGAIRLNAVKSRYGGLAMTSLRFSPKQNHLLYSASSDGTVHVTNCDTEEIQLIFEEKGNEINCMDFTRDGFSFATAGKDLAVRIYDSKTNQLSRKFEGFCAAKQISEQGPTSHASRVFALRWHPEYDHIFVSAGWDDSVKIWDCRSSTGVVRYIPGPHVCGDGLDVRGFRILTGSWKGNESVQIWDYSAGKLLKNVPYAQDEAGDGEFVYCAQFVNDVCVAAGGSGTNNVQIINTNTDECLGTIQMQKPVHALDSTGSGAKLAVGSGDSVLKFVNT